MKLQYIVGVLLASVCVPAAAEMAETRLPVEVVAPLSGSNATLWDLSGVLAEDCSGVDYRIYGDSIVSEEYDGIRCWYAADTCGLFRMESLLWRLDPVGETATGWRPAVADASVAFRAGVVRESMPDDTLSCRIDRKADVGGRLILPGPDTLRAVMRCETIGAANAGGEYVRETRRWFAAGDSRRCPLPVAVAVRQSYGNKLLGEAAFVAAQHEYPEADSRRPDLDALDISVSGGRLNINASSPLTAEVRIDITDLTGRSFLYITMGVGESTASLDLSPLPRGRYIAVLTAGDSTRKVAVAV